MSQEIGSQWYSRLITHLGKKKLIKKKTLHTLERGRIHQIGSTKALFVTKGIEITHQVKDDNEGNQDVDDRDDRKKKDK